MRIFILLLITLALALSAQAEKRIALLVGNSDYTGNAKPLANPVKDVDLMEDALESVGFEVHVLKNANRAQMLNAFQQHGDRLKAAGKDAVGLLYYAGHGVQSQGFNYLAPVDMTAYTEQHVWAQAARLGDAMDFLRYAGNKTNFIILDACRDNPLPTATRTSAGGLARLQKSRGMLIAYATQPGATASDGPGQKNSPFTAELARMLKQPGLPVESLFRKVATNVEIRTKDAQQPWYESGLRGTQDFCFAGCGAGANDEATALGIALASGELARLREFQSKFPGSRTRSLVQQQIAAIEQAEYEASRPVKFMTTSPSEEGTPLWERVRDTGWSNKFGRTIVHELGDELNFSQLKMAADAGDPNAATLVGMMLHDGLNGQEKAIPEAAKYYEFGCENDQMRACRSLALLHVLGIGVSKDESKANRLFTESCKGGIMLSCLNLGDQHAAGTGASEDDTAANHFYKTACDGGNALGCDRLGERYDFGNGITENDQEANRLYKKACDDGNMQGCTHLAYQYDDGEGVIVDKAKAGRLYKQACDGGNMQGCAQLGNKYSNGEGVPESDQEASRLWKIACKANFMSSCFNLAMMHDFGTGIAVDDELANQLYLTACEGGEMRGCNNLAAQYAAGEGVTKNEAEANRLYKKACDNEHMQGCGNLGHRIFKGQGTNKDETRGRELLQLACNAGITSSCNVLQEL